MVFSTWFGGKKDPAPASRQTAKGSASAPAEPPARPAATGRTPPAEASKSAPTTAPVEAPKPVEDRPPLEFSVDSQFSQSVVHESMAVELQDTSSAAHPVIDEAAMLFANGHDAAATSVLEAVIAQGYAGAGAEQMWSMLFDLYQIAGKREAFEAKALDYVVRFEKSPPTWIGTPTATKSTGMASLPLVTLNGSLSVAACARQIEQLRRIAGQSQRVRVDVARLQDADNDGCAMLLDALTDIKRAGQEVIVLNPMPLMELLERRIEEDGRHRPQAWLLLLELYQRQGQQERFEEMALEYAVNFEVSPPSWEARPKPSSGAASPTAAASDTTQQGDSYRLLGDVTGSTADLCNALTTYAAERKSVVMDASELRRMDFINAGKLLNTLSILAATGKSIRICGANSLVTALFGIIGVTQVASVERRK